MQHNKETKEKIKNLPFKFLAIRLNNGDYACRLVYDDLTIRGMSFSGNSIRRSSFPEIGNTLYLRGDQHSYIHSVFNSSDRSVCRWRNILYDKQDKLNPVNQ
jgi:hypothetical protein